VRDPSRLFLQQRQLGGSGSAITVSLEGSRPLLVEIQALVAPTHFGLPQRRVSGLDYNRSVLLLAVLERRANLNLGAQDVFLSVTGGLEVSEPAVDLGLALAVVSSTWDRPLPPDLVVCGEVGLGGEVRAVSQAARRLQAAAALGFRRCLLPRAQAPAPGSFPDLQLELVETLTEALTTVFPEGKQRR
jgi:DNA repair protein RadA/Sms